MTEPFASPEQDLDRLRQFLEAGAEVALEDIERITSVEPVAATVREPGVVLFDIAGERLVENLGQDLEQRILMDLDIGEMERGDDFYVHLFLGNERATADTSAEEPSFHTGFAFFCEPNSEHREMACPVGPDAAIRTQFDITETMRRVASNEPVSATLVLVPLGEETPEERSLSVMRAELRVVRSIVRPAG